MHNLAGELERMEDGVVLGRYDKKTNVIKTYKVEEDLERHDRQRHEGTRHMEED